MNRRNFFLRALAVLGVAKVAQSASLVEPWLTGGSATPMLPKDIVWDPHSVKFSGIRTIKEVYIPPGPYAPRRLQEAINDNTVRTIILAKGVVIPGNVWLPNDRAPLVVRSASA